MTTKPCFHSLLLGFTLFFLGIYSHAETIIRSPDGALTLSLKHSGGQLFYSVKKQSLAGETVAPIVTSSPIGPVLQQQGNKPGVEKLMISPSHCSRQEGTSYWEYCFSVGMDDGQLYGLQMRLFNNGVAWRYRFKQSTTIAGEDTAYQFPATTQLYHQAPSRNDEHEGTYTRSTVGDIDQLLPSVVTAQLPSGHYASILEANVHQYSGQRLRAQQSQLSLTSDFYDAQWTLEAGSVSPWRILVVADDLTGLVNHGLIAALTDQPDPALFADTHYIREGHVLWHWLADGWTGSSKRRQQAYVDAAAEGGFAYTLLDDGWEINVNDIFGYLNPFKNKFAYLKELVDYGRERNVGIWIWTHVKDVATPESRNQYFTALQKAGVAGIKVDFFDKKYGYSESIAAINAYENILQDAAQYQLMVNFHGASKPTGLEITYPNEMTREAVLGLEAGCCEGLLNPTHHSLLFFTRYLAGPGDYTPVILNRETLDISDTTLAHQWALAGLLHSKVQNISLNPEQIEELLQSNPLAMDILAKMPAQWDETLVLPGSTMGGLTMVARRSKQDWYLFIINGDYNQDDEAATFIKTPAIKLDFLGKRQYTAVSLWDKDKYSLEEKSLGDFSQYDLLSAVLLDRGGFVARFQPKTEQ